MHRGWKILAWAASILVALPVLAVGALLAIGNLGGAGWIAGWVTSLSGGELVIRDLSGTFPTAMRASQLVLRDAKGPWARADDLRLDWSPLALFHGVLHIDRLDAERVALLRRPVPTGKSGGGSAGLPVGVEIDALRVGRIALSPAVAGQAASLSLDGSLRLASLERGRRSRSTSRRTG
jgi:translocation and assembly module TamB